MTRIDARHAAVRLQRFEPPVRPEVKLPERARPDESRFESSFEAAAPQPPPAKLSRQEMINKMWEMARVPGHALTKLKGPELEQKLMEVAAAVSSPGKAEVKLGSYTLKVDIGPSGQLRSTSCKKQGFLSKVGSFVKKAIPIAATIAQFVPGIGTAVSAGLRIASAAISAVDAIKAKSWSGLLGAAASGLGAASKIAGGMAKTFDTVSKAAGAAAKTWQGVESIKRGGIGNVLAGAASIASGAAGALGDKFKGLSTDLAKGADRLKTAAGVVQTAEAIRQADRAVKQAKAALDEARASGDPEAIAQAQRALAQAERGKRSAILGGAAMGAGLLAQPGGKNAAHFRIAANALNFGRAVNDKSVGGMIASGLALGSSIKGRKGVEYNLDGTVRSDDLRDAARLGGAVNGLVEHFRSERQAKQGVEDAGVALARAKLSGDPGAIAEAKKNLELAKRGVHAISAGFQAAVDEVGAAAHGVASDRKSTQRTDQAVKAMQGQVSGGVKTLADLEALSEDPTANASVRNAARRDLEKLAQATSEYVQQIQRSGGDPAKVAAANAQYEKARREAESRFEALSLIKAPVAIPEPRPATDLDLPAKRSPSAPSSRPARAPSSARRPAGAPSSSNPSSAAPSWNLLDLEKSASSNRLEQGSRVREELRTIIYGEGKNMLADVVVGAFDSATGKVGKAKDLMTQIELAERQLRAHLNSAYPDERKIASSREQLEGLIRQANELQGKRDQSLDYGIKGFTAAKLGSDVAINALAPPWLKASYAGLTKFGEEVAKGESVAGSYKMAAAEGLLATILDAGAGKLGSKYTTFGQKLSIEGGKQLIEGSVNVYKELSKIQAKDPADFRRQVGVILSREGASRAMNMLQAAGMERYLGHLDANSQQKLAKQFVDEFTKLMVGQLNDKVVSPAIAQFGR